MNSDWFLDEQLWLEFYATMFSPEQFALAAEQIPQIIQLTGISTANILDLACGPGRHILPLAELGYPLTAVDTSAYLLGILDDKLEATPHQHSVEIIRADMRKFIRPKSFDLILSMWTSFGYFQAPGDDLKVLDNVYQSLTTGGKFLLDVAGKEYIIHNYEPLLTREISPTELLIEQPILLDNLSRLDNEWTLVSKDKVFRASFSLNIYTAVELQDRLLAAGFSTVQIFGDLDGSEYDLDSDRLILLATK
ncbi:MAG: class I SAM-dependent methyltransferase [Xanthomonadales bacterium]|nr:class I SAM-dependent methyltransferase [Xanthomonadales bacterium]